MRLVILFILVLFMIPSVEAIAIASDHLEKNTLNLTEGTSVIYSIRLQNTDSSEARYKVTYDDTLMKIIGYKEEYTVDSKSTIRIEFNVTAPEYVKNKNTFTLSYTVHQLSGSGGSGIPFLTKINKQFKLQVLKHPDRFYIDPFYFVIALSAIAFLSLVYRKRIIGFWKGRNKIKNRFKSRKVIKWKH